MLEDLNARFIWTKDQRDRWTLLDAKHGPLLGDCEDYALTALWLMCGRSWLHFWWMVLTFQAVFWHVRHVGNGSGPGDHFVLWVRKRGWIDSSFIEWRPRTPHHKKIPIIAPALALKILRKR